MTGHDSAAREYFEACVRDVTPARLAHVARVLYASVCADAEVSDLCESVLSDGERRQSRQKTAEHRAEFVQRRAFRRYCAAVAVVGHQSLSGIVFGKTDKGRPRLRDTPNLWVNFSSCRHGMLGAWSFARAIGVDIEDHTQEPESLAIARQFFTATEAAAVEMLGGVARRQAFYRLWCLKEAALKSIGEGMPFGLDTFEFELHPIPRLLGTPERCGGPGQFDIHEAVEDNVTMAVVIRDK